VNSSLVFRKCGFGVESATAILNTAEERHLLCSTIEGTMHLSLVAIQIAFVLKAATTVSILTHVDRNVISRILVLIITWFIVGIRYQTRECSKVLNTPPLTE